MVYDIASASSFEYSWSESRLKSGDLNLSRHRVLKCFLDDRNSRSDDRYAVSNGSGYTLNEYIVLDRLLDTSYPMEVDTPYLAIDQNSFSTPSGGTRGEVGLTSFRKAIRANYLAHSKDYIQPPSIEVVREWFLKIGYGEAIEAKGTLKRLSFLLDIDFAKLIWDDIISKLKNKNREKFIPYLRFLSLLLELRMEGYGTDRVTIIPTQIFSVNNLILKKGQHEGPSFTAHMLAIYKEDAPVAFQAPKTSSHIEKKDSQGSEPGAKIRRRRKHTSSTKQNPVSKLEATKSKPPSKEAAEIPTCHFKRKKESSSAMDSNPSEPSASTPVVAELYKEAHQATGDPKSLGVTSEKGAHLQLSSGMSALNFNKPIFLASFIIHSESASGRDVSVDSTAEADLGNSAPHDSIPQQEGRDEGTKNYSLDHRFAGTDPNVLGDKTKSVSEGLETVHATPETRKGAMCKEIKLEDLSKLVQNDQADFMDLDSIEDDLIIVVDEISKHKLEKEKRQAEAEVALLSSKPSFPNVAQLNELLWGILVEFLSVPTQVETVQAKLKTVDALPSLLNKVTQALNQFAQAIASTSKKTRDASVP
ncbi:hypothetical protein Tco_1033138 [Tanacetum coccineum]|uniref:Uncharacterized protein n=1 Tax=Tanacetum coccineum TaxID=301880 RepID=A0ABQ5GG46_9ASTR